MDYDEKTQKKCVYESKNKIDAKKDFLNQFLLP